MSDPATSQVGITLAGRYRLTEKIGEGGFGTIYRARQLNVDREVAIKVLPPRFNSLENVVERFRREAKLASRLHHPNTITTHDYGQDENLFFIVMEFLYGEDLAEVLRKEGRLSVDDAVHIVSQALRSLQEAHNLGIVHRDLKPENIFLTKMADEDRFVKVLDFGIAKLADPDPRNSLQGERNLTMQGSTVGTPAYMSPEQAAGEEVGPSSDVYTIGVILYELLNGSPPFVHERPVRTMRAHLFDEPPQFPNHDLRDTPIEGLVMRALHKDPSERFAEAGEFLKALAAENLSGARPPVDKVPFGSIKETPPPEGFSLQGSVTSSIITVLEEPNEENLIVLTEKKVTPEPLPAVAERSDEDEWRWTDAKNSQLLVAPPAPARRLGILRHLIEVGLVALVVLVLVLATLFFAGAIP